MLTLLVLVTAIVVAAVYLLHKSRRPTGAPPALGVLDNIRWLRQWRFNQYGLVKEMAAKYGPAFSVQMPGFRLNIIASREFAEQYFFKAKEHTLSFNKILWRFFFHWAPAEITAETPEWILAERLRIVHQVFSPGKYSAFLPSVLDVANSCLDALAKKRNVPDLHYCIREFINTVNFRVAVGDELSAPGATENMAKLVSTLDAANSWISWICPKLFITKEVDKARHELFNVIKGISEAKSKNLLQPDVSLLGQLLKAGLPFDDVYVSVIGTMLAAFVNTAGTLTWAITELLHPEYGKKWFDQVYEEQLQVIAQHGEEITLPALNSMEILQRVIMEIGRKYTLFGHSRLVKKQDEWNGYVFPVGEIVLFPIVICNLDPNIHPNPSFFDPDRYLKPEARTTFNHMQFGAGVHRCKGEFFAMMVLKIFMSLWIRRFKTTLLLDKFPGVYPFHVGGIYSPDVPLPILLEPRN